MTTRFVHSLIKLTLLFLPMAGLQAQSVYVPLNHWAYQFIERFEAKGVITGALNSTRPYSRAEMVEYLVQIQDNVHQGYRLNAVEEQQLQFLRFEFGEEFKHKTGRNGVDGQSRIARLKQSKVFGKIFPGFLYKNNRNLFEVNSEGFKAFIDPVFYQQWLYATPDTVSGTEKVFERTHGLTLRGQLGTHLGFFFDFRDTKQWGTRTYPDRFDISLEGLGFVNGYGTHIWHDETNAYLVFKLPYLQLVLGKGVNTWGPGFNGALGLSDNATSFDQIKLQTKLWRLKFTYLWGFLRTFPRIAQADGTTNPKSIVAHRLEIDVAKWLDVGLYEMVVFGDRRFEFAYINPINFYRSAEHFVSDDDNASIGFDFELLLIPNVKLYGELFIDDLTTSKIGSGFHGNKTGVLAGGLWADAFQVDNLDLRVEYARTRPYLYTHRKAINTYSHFNTGLGHWLGPNADNLFARVQYRFSKSFFIAATFQSTRHGDNPPDKNTGGDLTRPVEDGGQLSVSFLEGIRESRQSVSFEARYELFRNLYLGVNYDKDFSDNILLPAGARGPVDRGEFFLNVGLNR
ncbi:MAG: capsule assembly Wzi family protein [bacterium]